MQIKDEDIKTLRMGFCYLREFEEAFKKYSLTDTYKKLRKLYGIDTDSEETTKKKI